MRRVAVTRTPPPDRSLVTLLAERNAVAAVGGRRQLRLLRLRRLLWRLSRVRRRWRGRRRRLRGARTARGGRSRRRRGRGSRSRSGRRRRRSGGLDGRLLRVVDRLVPLGVLGLMSRLG